MLASTQLSTPAIIIELYVRNIGNRPIQIGSYFHFFNANPSLEFDREKAIGFHLNVPACTFVRFEPGEGKTVRLVAYAKKRLSVSFAELGTSYTGREDFPVYYPKRLAAFRRAAV